MVCEHCGKRGMVGNRVSHSKRRTKHRFDANIQTVHVLEGARNVRKTLCAKCIKALNKV
ncbi:MAG: 50S ribosomal protein L28 [Aggregatilineales bacterium]